MLEEIHITNLALIEDVRLNLADGFTVFTGETGAGKTVLVGALKLLLGERADSTLVRSGASEAVIEGRFSIDGVEHTVLRRISADGRSRCYLDGAMSTVAALGTTLGPLVDLHGQHDHQLLLSAASHAGYLDRFIGPAAMEALRAYQEAWATQQAAAQKYRTLLRASTQQEAQRLLLETQLEELLMAKLRSGEDEDLELRMPRLRHAEKLTEASLLVYRQLTEEDASEELRSKMGMARRRAEGLDPTFDELLERFEGLRTDMRELAVEFQDYAEDTAYSPEALNTGESRLSLLSTLKRKYGPTLDEVIEKREELQRQLGDIDAGPEALEEARLCMETNEVELVSAAAALTKVRRSHARDFVRALARDAQELAMPGATFEVKIEDLRRSEWSADGPHQLEFLFSPNHGEILRPLVKIASGGEVSRVMLALKSVLGSADTTPVLVFDEVDTGIGGNTALAIGRKLRRLSAEHQVLVVTHLAQVAAFADAQLVVSKETLGERTITTVAPVDGTSRVEEIARMLSGSRTEASMTHAKELLESVENR